MNKNIRKFAVFGLYLAGVALLAAAGLYIVQRSFNLPLQIALGVAVVGLALFILLDPDGFKQKLTGRQARHGGNSLVIILAFTGILIVANILGNKYSKSWDLTADKTNTLAPETIEALKTIKAPIHAQGYFTTRFPTGNAQAVFEKFKANSNGLFTYEFIDPEANPVAAQRAQVTRDGTVVLIQQDRREPLSSVSETELINAMVRIDNPGDKTIYFLTGHGEAAIEGTSDVSLQRVVASLKTKNYTVEPLSLLAERAIPENAKAIVIAGPHSPVSAEEIDLIAAYLQSGGALIYLGEPTVITQSPASEDLLNQWLAANWGLSFNDDLVIDPNYNPPNLAVAASYGNHPITAKMQNQVVIMPNARSITLAEPAPPGAILTNLIGTSQNSWGETNLDEISGEKITFDAGFDISGPLSIAASAENLSLNSRIVLIGDAEFANDTYFDQYGNSLFIQNAIDWAAGQDNLINITPHTPEQRLLVLRSTTQMNLIFLVSVVVLPGLVVLAGVLVWISRRRKG